MSHLWQLTRVLCNLRTTVNYRKNSQSNRKSELFTEKTSEMKLVTEIWKKGTEKARINWFVNTKSERNV